ncbi:MAG: hypothetical protein DHS20C11_37860 [Lysobacteraceae bacterium]|nr:MAG: hypothetical protein DHS20C11_37860 [Xanthomonadaceae bacterium]
MLAGLTRLALGLLTLAYPFVVYFGLSRFQPSIIALLLVAVLAVRLGLASGTERTWVFWPLLVLLSYSIAAVITGSQLMLLIYPVLVSLCFLSIFAWTLFRPPSLIERIVRARGEQISEFGPPYMRTVTIVWCGFFIANAIVAAYTVTLSLSAWTLYNGLLSYLAIGTLGCIELVCRRAYKRKHGVI